MKILLPFLLMFLMGVCLGQSNSQSNTFDPTAERYMPHPDVLVVLKEPHNLETRLKAIIAQIESHASKHEGEGEIPRSVSEAAEFVEHSTHLRAPMRHGIEYHGYYIFSDILPKDFKEWMVAGSADKPNESMIFTTGYAVKKGKRTIYSFNLSDNKSK